jgi:hypothetical protein
MSKISFFVVTPAQTVVDSTGGSHNSAIGVHCAADWKKREVSIVPQMKIIIFPQFRSKNFIFPLFRSKIFIFPLFRSKKLFSHNSATNFLFSHKSI